MALYRLGEKVIPAVLLLLSVAYIVDASYNPFCIFDSNREGGTTYG